MGRDPMVHVRVCGHATVESVGLHKGMSSLGVCLKVPCVCLEGNV